MAGSCEHSNEGFNFIKGGKFRSRLRDCHLTHIWGITLHEYKYVI
jgi:hypothetical protein